MEIGKGPGKAFRSRIPPHGVFTAKDWIGEINFELTFGFQLAGSIPGHGSSRIFRDLSEAFHDGMVGRKADHSHCNQTGFLFRKPWKLFRQVRGKAGDVEICPKPSLSLKPCIAEPVCKRGKTPVVMPENQFFGNNLGGILNNGLFGNVFIISVGEQPERNAVAQIGTDA